jgi:hypothetical protein
MTTPPVRTAIFIAACFFLNAGCDTPQGADALARLLPRVSVRGPGFGGSFRVPSDALKSSKLKFQEAVLRNDISRATRHLNPRYVDAPIKGYPPVFYAAARGQTAMVKMLVSNGASAKRLFTGRSLAYVAASFGHSETAEQLVRMGGGTRGDVSYGKSVYAANSRAQRQRVQAGTQLALVFLAAMLSGLSDSSSSGPWDPFGGISERQYKNAQKGYLSLSEIGPF